MGRRNRQNARIAKLKNSAPNPLNLRYEWAPRIALMGTDGSSRPVVVTRDRMGVLMAVTETNALAEAVRADATPEPYSVAWWESLTPEQLRDIIRRGFSSGETFQAAVAETERRARQETKRLRELAAAESLARRKRLEIVWGLAASALSLAALLGFWLAR